MTHSTDCRRIYTHACCVADCRVMADALSVERVRQMQLSMQTTLERTRDVRRRRHRDAMLHAPARCRLPRRRAQLPATSQHGRLDDNNDDDDDDL